MNTPYDSLIASELSKIEVLKAKIKECEHRISVLRSMQTDDDLDAALTRKVQAPLAPSAPAPRSGEPSDTAKALGAHAEASHLDRTPKKTLSEQTLKMLRFAGSGGNVEKSIDQFLDYATADGITQKNRQRMRAFLHTYKATYGLLASDRDGHFRLSDEGIAYLASRSSDASTSEGEATSAR